MIITSKKDGYHFVTQGDVRKKFEYSPPNFVKILMLFNINISSGIAALQSKMKAMKTVLNKFRFMFRQKLETYMFSLCSDAH